MPVKITFKNMQELLMYINNPANYKAARKKQYQIWCCLPPVGTHVHNFLENIDYTTSDAARFVLSGTRGEQWVIKGDKLAKTYTFADGTPINAETLRKYQDKSGNASWFRVQTSGDASRVWACFVPAAYTFPFQTSWGNMMCNQKGIPHGYGDFIIRSDAGGQPSSSGGYVCNGAVFADTYDNRGWVDYIKQSADDVNAPMPKPLFASANTDASVPSASYKALCDLLERCKQASAQEMPFNYKAENGTIVVVPSVIKDYKRKAAESAGVDINEFDHCKTVITFKKGEIVFDGYNIFNSQSPVHTFQFKVPDSPEGINQILSAPQLYVGLMGWVPNGMHNYFTYRQKPAKYMCNGVIEYTKFSGGINRKCRLQDYESETNKRGYERVGQESRRLYRAIDGCDAFLDNAYLNKSIFLFRGMPASVALKLANVGSIDALAGATIVNTAYTSSTLNMHSTMLFSKTRDDPNNGVILAINAPVGLKAALIHDIAARGSQFEVLWQRCYDIRVSKKMMVFSGGGNFTYHVFMAEVVPHVPFSRVPLDTSHHSNVANIECYDENGRVRFDYEKIYGYMQEAFHELRTRGLNETVQIQPNFVTIGDPRDYIIVRSNEDDAGYIVDLAFSYNNDTHMIDVYRFKSRKDLQDQVDVRNHWGRSHDGGIADHDMSWENYKADEMMKLGVQDAFNWERKSSITLKKDGRPLTVEEFTLVRESGMGKLIADSILEYVKYNKDVTLLPMQDIARYFDVIFKNVIITEGYWLKDSIPVVRVGNPTEPNDGYVPLKYRIDGDNDDSLVISMKLSRDENGKLQMTYRGQSQNNKVNEQKQLRWNIFNQDIMEQTCKQIMYTFASKLNLNHVRKGDMLMSCIARYKHYALTGTRYTEADNPQLMKVEDKASQRIYKLYFSKNVRDFAKVRITTEQRVMKVDIATEKGTKSGQLDATLPITELYKQLSPVLEQLRGGYAA